MKERIRQYELHNGVPWSMILDGMYPRVTTHRGTLRRLLTESRPNGICEHLGVSRTALENKFWHESIVVKKLDKLIFEIDTAGLTKRQIAEILGCTESRVGQLVRKLDIPFRLGKSLLKEKRDERKSGGNDSKER